MIDMIKLDYIALFFHIIFCVQPENPAQLGGKIYEMMGMALAGKWSEPGQVQYTGARSQASGTVEAEVVEPAEVGNQK